MVTITKDGTRFNSIDPAEGKSPERKSSGRSGERSDLEDAKEDRKRARALLNFISVCVVAYSEGRLSPSFPRAPQTLKKQIAKMGGNIRWLSSDQRLQVEFHRRYCKLRGEAIPYEKVWASPPKR